MGSRHTRQIAAAAPGVRFPRIRTPEGVRISTPVGPYASAPHSARQVSTWITERYTGASKGEGMAWVKRLHHQILCQQIVANTNTGYLNLWLRLELLGGK